MVQVPLLGAECLGQVEAGGVFNCGCAGEVDIHEMESILKLVLKGAVMSVLRVRTREVLWVKARGGR